MEVNVNRNRLVANIIYHL